jgi:hypothetical protein
VEATSLNRRRQHPLRYRSEHRTRGRFSGRPLSSCGGVSAAPRGACRARKVARFQRDGQAPRGVRFLVDLHWQRNAKRRTASSRLANRGCSPIQRFCGLGYHGVGRRLAAQASVQLAATRREIPAVLAVHMKRAPVARDSQIPSPPTMHRNPAAGLITRRSQVRNPAPATAQGAGDGALCFFRGSCCCKHVVRGRVSWA